MQLINKNKSKVNLQNRSPNEEDDVTDRIRFTCRSYHGCAQDLGELRVACLYYLAVQPCHSQVPLGPSR